VAIRAATNVNPICGKEFRHIWWRKSHKTQGLGRLNPGRNGAAQSSGIKTVARLNAGMFRVGFQQQL